MTTLQPNKNLAAVCGLFCPACTFYIGSTADPDRLKRLAERLQKTAEEIECHGCSPDGQACISIVAGNGRRDIHVGIFFPIISVYLPRSDAKPLQVHIGQQPGSRAALAVDADIF